MKERIIIILIFVASIIGAVYVKGQINFIVVGQGIVRPSKEQLKTKHTVDKFLKIVEQGNEGAAFNYWMKPGYSKYSKQQKIEVRENLKLIINVLKKLKHFSYVDSPTDSYVTYSWGPEPPKPKVPPATLYLEPINSVSAGPEGYTEAVVAPRGSHFYLEHYKAQFEDFNGLEVTFSLWKPFSINRVYIREIIITGPQPLILKLLTGQDYITFNDTTFYFPLDESQKLRKAIRKAIIEDKWTIKECNQLTEGIDSCIEEIALLWEDPSLCSQIIALSVYDRRKVECIGAVAKKAEDVSMCEEITISDFRDSCIVGVATELKNAELCEEISAETDEYTKLSPRMQCYSNVAGEKRDVKLCDKAGGYRDVCIEYIAMKLLDENLCTASSINQRASCYNEVAKTKEAYYKREKYLNRFNSN